jgi:hypothetical protein
MTRRTIQGVFAREDDLLRAARTAQREGWRIVDIYAPYAMHETARLLGLERSRLPRAAFVFGLMGVALAFWFQYWVSAFDWPLNVGGRPWNSLPAFVPVAFEMMVLCGGLGIVLTWLIVCRLYPGKKAVLPSPLVTDDHFVLEVEGPGPDADPNIIRRLFQDCRASDLKEMETP